MAAVILLILALGGFFLYARNDACAPLGMGGCRRRSDASGDIRLHERAGVACVAAVCRSGVALYPRSAPPLRRRADLRDGEVPQGLRHRGAGAGKPEQSGSMPSCFPERPTGASCTPFRRSNFRTRNAPFSDGPTEELCRMISDWQICHTLREIPHEIWAFAQKARVPRHADFQGAWRSRIFRPGAVADPR